MNDNTILMMEFKLSQFNDIRTKLTNNNITTTDSNEQCNK